MYNVIWKKRLTLIGKVDQGRVGSLDKELNLSEQRRLGLIEY